MGALQLMRLLLLVALFCGCATAQTIEKDGVDQWQNTAVVYVDSVLGDDNATGVSPQTAYQTLDYAMDLQETNEDVAHIIFLMPGNHTVASNHTVRGSLAIYGTGKDDNNGTLVLLENGARFFSVETYNETKSIVLAHLKVQGGENTFGGALLVTGSVLLKTFNVTFANNTAADDGGAVYFFAGPKSRLEFQQTKFQYNSARNGGALVLDLYGEAEAFFTNCTFDSNVARLGEEDGFGGALWLANGRASLSGSLFHKNFAPVSGGAVFLRGTETWVDHTRFVNNTANKDGACLLAQAGSKVYVDGSHFTSSHGNGAVSVKAASTTNIWYSLFERSHGAALVAEGQGASVLAEHTEFQWGTHTAVHLKNNEDWAVFRSCRFTGNQAGKNFGGAMNIESSSPAIVHCVFDGNGANRGGALYATGESNPVVNNTVFYNNSVGTDCTGSLEFNNGTQAWLNYVLVERHEGSEFEVFDTAATTCVDFTAKTEGPDAAAYWEGAEQELGEKALQEQQSSQQSSAAALLPGVSTAALALTTAWLGGAGGAAALGAFAFMAACLPLASAQPYQWQAGPWQPPCNGGCDVSQTRTVGCYDMGVGKGGTLVTTTPSPCDGASKPSEGPTVYGDCPKCLGYFTTQWMPFCPETGCGDPVPQERTVTCKETSPTAQSPPSYPLQTCIDTLEDRIPSSARTCNPSLGPCTYAWTVSPWSFSCSDTRNCGLEATRTKDCVDNAGNSYGSEPPRGTCSVFVDIPTRQTCPRCVQYEYSAFGSCSANCDLDNGDPPVESRTATCILAPSEPLQGQVPMSECEAQWGPPQLTQPCDPVKDLCPLAWYNGPEGPCSDDCDGGIKNRPKLCRRELRNVLEQAPSGPSEPVASRRLLAIPNLNTLIAWEPVNRTLCVAQFGEPPLSQTQLPCNTHACFYTWVEGNANPQPWGNCTQLTCELAGIQTRQAACSRLDSPVVDATGARCSEFPMPADEVQACNGTEQQLVEQGRECYHWEEGAWGTCSQSCGGGRSLRWLECQADISGTLGNEYKCFESDRWPRPEESQLCGQGACPDLFRKIWVGEQLWMLPGRKFAAAPTPGSEAIVLPGQGKDVEWSYEGLSSFLQVNVLLVPQAEDEWPYLLASSINNDGTFFWEIARDIPAGFYRLRVQAAMEHAVFGDSPVFRIGDLCAAGPGQLPCMNGAQCSDGRCVCPAGFAGELCDGPAPDVCEGVTCANNGTCVNGECECVSGYRGTKCELEASSRCGGCANGGAVLDSETCECACQGGWDGPRCETCGMGSWRCGARGVADRDCQACVCAEGFVGDLCEVHYVELDACMSVDPALDDQAEVRARFAAILAADVAAALTADTTLEAEVRPDQVQVHSVAAGGAPGQSRVTLRIFSGDEGLDARKDDLGNAMELARRAALRIEAGSQQGETIYGGHASRHWCPNQAVATRDTASSLATASPKKSMLPLIAAVVAGLLVLSIAACVIVRRRAGTQHRKHQTNAARMAADESGVEMAAMDEDDDLGAFESNPAVEAGTDDPPAAPPAPPAADAPMADADVEFESNPALEEDMTGIQSPLEVEAGADPGAASHAKEYSDCDRNNYDENGRPKCPCKYRFCCQCMNCCCCCQCCGNTKVRIALYILAAGLLIWLGYIGYAVSELLKLRDAEVVLGELAVSELCNDDVPISASFFLDSDSSIEVGLKKAEVTVREYGSLIDIATVNVPELIVTKGNNSYVNEPTLTMKDVVVAGRVVALMQNEVAFDLEADVKATVYTNALGFPVSFTVGAKRLKLPIKPKPEVEKIPPRPPIIDLVHLQGDQGTKLEVDAKLEAFLPDRLPNFKITLPQDLAISIKRRGEIIGSVKVDETVVGKAFNVSAHASVSDRTDDELSALHELLDRVMNQEAYDLGITGAPEGEVGAGNNCMVQQLVNSMPELPVEVAAIPTCEAENPPYDQYDRALGPDGLPCKDLNADPVVELSGLELTGLERQLGAGDTSRASANVVILPKLPFRITADVPQISMNIFSGADKIARVDVDPLFVADGDDTIDAHVNVVLLNEHGAYERARAMQRLDDLQLRVQGAAEVNYLSAVLYGVNQEIREKVKTAAQLAAEEAKAKIEYLLRISEDAGTGAFRVAVELSQLDFPFALYMPPTTVTLYDRDLQSTAQFPMLNLTFHENLIAPTPPGGSTQVVNLVDLTIEQSQAANLGRFLSKVMADERVIVAMDGDVDADLLGLTGVVAPVWADQLLDFGFKLPTRISHLTPPVAPAAAVANASDTENLNPELDNAGPTVFELSRLDFYSLFRNETYAQLSVALNASIDLPVQIEGTLPAVSVDAEVDGQKILKVSLTPTDIPSAQSNIELRVFVAVNNETRLLETVAGAQDPEGFDLGITGSANSGVLSTVLSELAFVVPIPGKVNETESPDFEPPTVTPVSNDPPANGTLDFDITTTSTDQEFKVSLEIALRADLKEKLPFELYIPGFDVGLHLAWGDGFPQFMWLRTEEVRISNNGMETRWNVLELGITLEQAAWTGELLNKFLNKEEVMIYVDGSTHSAVDCPEDAFLNVLYPISMDMLTPSNPKPRTESKPPIVVDRLNMVHLFLNESWAEIGVLTQLRANLPNININGDLPLVAVELWRTYRSGSAFLGRVETDPFTLDSMNPEVQLGILALADPGRMLDFTSDLKTLRSDRNIRLAITGERGRGVFSTILSYIVFEFKVQGTVECDPVRPVLPIKDNPALNVVLPELELGPNGTPTPIALPASTTVTPPTPVAMQNKSAITRDTSEPAAAISPAAFGFGAKDTQAQAREDKKKAAGRKGNVYAPWLGPDGMMPNPLADDTVKLTVSSDSDDVRVRVQGWLPDLPQLRENKFLSPQFVLGLGQMTLDILHDTPDPNAPPVRPFLDDFLDGLDLSNRGGFKSTAGDGSAPAGSDGWAWNSPANPTALGGHRSHTLSREQHHTDADEHDRQVRANPLNRLFSSPGAHRPGAAGHVTAENDHTLGRRFHTLRKGSFAVDEGGAFGTVTKRASELLDNTTVTQPRDFPDAAPPEGTTAKTAWGEAAPFKLPAGFGGVSPYVIDTDAHKRSFGSIRLNEMQISASERSEVDLRVDIVQPDQGVYLISTIREWFQGREDLPILIKGNIESDGVAQRGTVRIALGLDAKWRETGQLLLFARRPIQPFLPGLGPTGFLLPGRLNDKLKRINTWANRPTAARPQLKEGTLQVKLKLKPIGDPEIVKAIEATNLVKIAQTVALLGAGTVALSSQLDVTISTLTAAKDVGGASTETYIDEAPPLLAEVEYEPVRSTSLEEVVAPTDPVLVEETYAPITLRGRRLLSELEEQQALRQQHQEEHEEQQQRRLHAAWRHWPTQVHTQKSPDHMAGEYSLARRPAHAHGSETSYRVVASAGHPMGVHPFFGSSSSLSQQQSSNSGDQTDATATTTHTLAVSYRGHSPPNPLTMHATPPAAKSAQQSAGSVGSSSGQGSSSSKGALYHSHVIGQRSGVAALGDKHHYWTGYRLGHATPEWRASQPHSSMSPRAQHKQMQAFAEKGEEESDGSSSALPKHFHDFQPLHALGLSSTHTAADHATIGISPRESGARARIFGMRPKYAHSGAAHSAQPPAAHHAMSHEERHAAVLAHHDSLEVARDHVQRRTAAHVESLLALWRQHAEEAEAMPSEQEQWELDEEAGLRGEREGRANSFSAPVEAMEAAALSLAQRVAEQREEQQKTLERLQAASLQQQLASESAAGVRRLLTHTEGGCDNPALLDPYYTGPPITAPHTIAGMNFDIPCPVPLPPAAAGNGPCVCCDEDGVDLDAEPEEYDAINDPRDACGRRVPPKKPLPNIINNLFIIGNKQGNPVRLPCLFAEQGVCAWDLSQFNSDSTKLSFGANVTLPFDALGVAFPLIIQLPAVEAQVSSLGSPLAYANLRPVYFNSKTTDYLLPEVEVSLPDAQLLRQALTSLSRPGQTLDLSVHGSLRQGANMLSKIGYAFEQELSQKSDRSVCPPAPSPPEPLRIDSLSLMASTQNELTMQFDLGGEIGSLDLTSLPVDILLGDLTVEVYYRQEVVIEINTAIELFGGKQNTLAPAIVRLKGTGDEISVFCASNYDHLGANKNKCHVSDLLQSLLRQFLDTFPNPAGVPLHVKVKFDNSFGVAQELQLDLSLFPERPGMSRATEVVDDLTKEEKALKKEACAGVFCGFVFEWYEIAAIVAQGLNFIVELFTRPGLYTPMFFQFGLEFINPLTFPVELKTFLAYKIQLRDFDGLDMEPYEFAGINLLDIDLNPRDPMNLTPYPIIVTNLGIPSQLTGQTPGAESVRDRLDMRATFAIDTVTLFDAGLRFVDEFMKKRLCLGIGAMMTLRFPLSDGTPDFELPVPVDVANLGALSEEDCQLRPKCKPTMTWLQAGKPEDFGMARYGAAEYWYGHAYLDKKKTSGAWIAPQGLVAQRRDFAINVHFQFSEANKGGEFAVIFSPTKWRIQKAPDKDHKDAYSWNYGTDTMAVVFRKSNTGGFGSSVAVEWDAWKYTSKKTKQGRAGKTTVDWHNTDWHIADIYYQFATKTMYVEMDGKPLLNVRLNLNHPDACSVTDYKDPVSAGFCAQPNPYLYWGFTGYRAGNAVNKGASPVIGWTTTFVNRASPWESRILAGGAETYQGQVLGVVGDEIELQIDLRDSCGNPLYDRTVTKIAVEMVAQWPLSGRDPVEAPYPVLTSEPGIWMFKWTATEPGEHCVESKFLQQPDGWTQWWARTLCFKINAPVEIGPP